MDKIITRHFVEHATCNLSYDAMTSTPADDRMKQPAASSGRAKKLQKLPAWKLLGDGHGHLCDSLLAGERAHVRRHAGGPLEPACKIGSASTRSSPWPSWPTWLSAASRRSKMSRSFASVSSSVYDKRKTREASTATSSSSSTLAPATAVYAAPMSLRSSTGAEARRGRRASHGGPHVTR